MISELGVGVRSEVYLAQETNLDRQVALKVLPADVTSKAEADNPT
jgi:serine/threonine protein kinase